MKLMTSLFSRVLLALALATGAGAAVAGPVYHVDIDTSLYSGDGFLDLSFLGAPEPGSVTAVTATAFGFSKDFGEIIDSFGDLSGSTADSVVFGYNAYMFAAVTLGHHLEFDVSFSGIDSDAASAATLFASTLYGADESVLDGGVLNIRVLAGEAPQVEIGDNGAITVPEPATLLSILSGLGLLGFVRRRRA